MIEVERVANNYGVFYYIKGTKILHREDGPAEETISGARCWYIRNKRHRMGGPAVKWSDGSEEWYYNDFRHREDGPAVEWSEGTKEWWVNGKRHRVDGPAIEHSYGDNRWCLNGNILAKEAWFEALTEEQKVRAFYSEYFIRG